MADLGLPPPALRRQPTTLHSLGDDLLREILVRLPSLPSLVRAAVACPAFLHAVRSSPAFRRRFQALHPPQLLGFFHDNCRVGIPAFSPLRARFDPDHTAVIRRADFLITGLTEHIDCYRYGWAIQSCHHGYVLFINVTTDQLAAYNPVSESLHVLPCPPHEISESGTLEYHIVCSQDDPYEFRLLCVVQRKMPACLAVYSSATREWSPVPQHDEGGRQDISDFDVGTQVGGVLYWKHESGRALVMSTSTLELSAINLPELLRDKLYALSHTADGRLRVAGLDDSVAKTASFYVWSLVPDDAGVQQWILEEDPSLLTDFVDEDGEAEIDDDATLQVEALIDGFVYISTRWCEEDSLLSICLETEEMDVLFDQGYARATHPYFMAWPPSFIRNKGLADLLNPRSISGIERMGELDEKPFLRACKERFGTEAETKVLEFFSLWQDNLRDADWHPFKMVAIGETHKQIIDEGDEKLVGLKEQLGEEVYKAVTTALLQINEYRKEKKKGSMGGIVEHILKQ